jgi:hypothetical protein
MTGTMDKRIKLIFLGFILLVFAIIFSLAITRKEVVNNKTELSTEVELSTVKFNIRDLTKHGISLIAPSDPILTGNRKPVTNNPYSIVLKNDSGRPIVGKQRRCSQCPPTPASTFYPTPLAFLSPLRHYLPF